MFERFTERARQVVVLAQDEARALRHNYIGTEHILLGLLREEEGLAARALESLDVTLGEARAEVARIVGRGEETKPGQVPFTPRAKKVLELALREALSLGHNYIGTEHVLLGLLRVEKGVAAQILSELEAPPADIHNELFRILQAPTGPHSGRIRDSALPSFQPTSPPFDPTVVDELKRIRGGAEQAIQGKHLEIADALRASERRLFRTAWRFQRAWSLLRPK